MSSSHEARLLAAVEQAHEQIVLARLERDREHQESARTARICLALQEQLLALEAAVSQSEQRRAADADEAVARLSQRHAEFTAGLAAAARARDTLAQQLNAATAALEDARRARDADGMAAAQILRTRQAEFEAALAAAAASRAAAEEQIERLQAALQDAEVRDALERAADAERSAARDAEAAAALAQISDERDTLARQLNAATAALEDSRQQRAREQAEAQAALEATAAEAIRARTEAEERQARELAAAAASRAAAEQDIARLRADYQAAAARHASERAADAERSAARDAAAAAALAQISDQRDTLARQLNAATALLEQTAAQAAATRESLERQLADAAAAFERAAAQADSERIAASNREQAIRHDLARVRRRLLAAASALRRRTAAQKAHAMALFAEERSGLQRRLDTREEALRQAEAERDMLELSLGATRDELEALRDRADGERREFERVRAISESELHRLRAESDHTRQSLDHLRDAFETLERASSEHALERARLEGVVAERDSQLSAQAAAHLAAERAAAESLRLAGETLRQTIDASVQESRRQFEKAPHALCRVTTGGVLVAANHALAGMLGYRSADDLGRPDLATAVFEAPDDLRWLIESAAGGGTLAPVETSWKRKDRTRLIVRLRAVRTTEEWIEIAAEDITLLRATENDLREARRLESVGRLASEVAVTCDTLLRAVSHGGQYWLAAVGGDLGHRRQGERLLGDVAQATSLLQRLAAYGHEQIEALQPVNLQHVLRNLEPVLQRVAGDDIEVVLPKRIRAYSIDVERTRVERALVNVAGYARQRMVHGGRLNLDLAATLVDRAFLDKYPNVRPGPHVLITVTEELRATSAGLPVRWPATPLNDDRTGADQTTAVDLSALLRLVGDCGGHLWVAAEPPGNMTLKIHLPLRPSDHAAAPAGSLMRSGGSRSLHRWSRH